MELAISRSLRIKQWVYGFGLPVVAIGAVATLFWGGFLALWPTLILGLGGVIGLNFITLLFSKSQYKINYSIWKATEPPTAGGWELGHQVKLLHQQLKEKHGLLKHTKIEARYDYHRKSFSYIPNFAVAVVGFHCDFLIEVPKSLKEALTYQGQFDEEAMNADLLHALLRMSLRESGWYYWISLFTNTLQLCVDQLSPIIKKYPLVEFLLSPILLFVNSLSLRREICLEADRLVTELGYGESLKRFLWKASLPKHESTRRLCLKHPVTRNKEDLSPYSYKNTSWKHWVERFQLFWHELTLASPSVYSRLSALEKYQKSTKQETQQQQQVEIQDCLLCRQDWRQPLVIARDNHYNTSQEDQPQMHTLRNDKPKLAA